MVKNHQKKNQNPTGQPKTDRTDLENIAQKVHRRLRQVLMPVRPLHDALSREKYTELGGLEQGQVFELHDILRLDIRLGREGVVELQDRLDQVGVERLSLCHAEHGSAAI